MLGDTLGHYRLDEKIGSGGMGEVYRAHDEHLDRDVALKVLPAGTLADEAARKQFRKEALAIAKFNHPNIATVHEFNCQNGVDFLAMELIRGRSLKEILKEGPLGEEEIRRLGLQLAEALASAHEHGVVHRDLKPANIMITRDGRLKILDFGLAKLMQSIGGDVIQSSTGAGSATGTVPYMAPEQLRGETSFDPRADVYAAGAVLYEMATSRRAFAENNWPQLIDSILHQAPEPPCQLNAKISAAMQGTILKALEKDPEKRQQSARGLQFELQAISPVGVEMKSAASIEHSQAPPLEIAHVLFMDIVAYSTLPMDEQRHQLRELQTTVRGTSEFIRAKSADQLISLPTGDGMALVFFGDSEYPLRCAVELSRALRNNPQMKLRMGIHTGPVFRVADVNAARNVAGGGINMAQRVMDCGDAGHILLSKTEVDVLGQLGCWNHSLHELGEVEIKHGERIHLFNFYTDEVGNSKLPNKLRMPRGSRKSATGSGRRLRTSDPGLSTPQQPKSARKIVSVRKHSRVSGTAPWVSIEVSRWRWVLMVGSLIALGIAGLTISPVREWVFNIHSGRNNPPAGVPPLEDGIYLGVIPFGVDGDRSTLGYIAEGLNEELSRKLSSLRAVHVVSSADAEAVAERQKIDLKAPLETVARNLGVNLIVQGNVVEAGGWIHVNVDLEDVAGHKLIWNRTFSDAAAEINLLNRTDQIYEKIIKELKLKPDKEEQARAARPTNKIDAYDLYVKGRNAARSRGVNALSSAVDFYDEALRRDPSFALAYAGLADADRAMYRETSEISWASKALGAAQQAERMNDNLPEVHLSLGSAYRELGRTGEAVAEFERAKQLSPNSDGPWQGLGRTYQDAGRMDEAIEAFRKATLINPYSLSNQNDLGVTYLDYGDYAKALPFFRRIIELDPNNVYGHQNIGVVYFQQGKYAESIAEFQETLKHEPSADIYSDLGLASLYLKRYADAISFSEKAAQMQQNNETIVGNLAWVYYWSGHRNRAMEAYDKAIILARKKLDLNPKAPYVLGDLAQYYAKIGEMPLADSYITQARAGSPSDPSLIYQEAQIRAAAGRPTQVISLLRSAFEKGLPPEQAKLDPEFSSLQGNLEFQKLVNEFSGKSN